MIAIKSDLFPPICRTLALALAVSAFARTALGNDWPQWQGPDRTAHSKETGLLKEWPKDGPPLAWKTKGLGGGDSMVSVASGRIYGMSNRGSDEFVWLFQRRTERRSGRCASRRLAR